MDEENPLKVPEAPVPFIRGHRNKKGRPRKDNCIEFTTQPKSVISLLLSEMRAKNRICLPLKNSSEGDITKETPQDTYQSPVSSPRSSDEDPVADYDVEYEVYPPRKKHKKEKNKIKNNTNILKIYSCDFQNCTYTSKLLSNVTKHKRVHTSEKPYLCDRCSFRSNFANSLKAHSRLHTGERPYCCQQCKYQCNSISNLKKHCLARHKDVSIPTEIT